MTKPLYLLMIPFLIAALTGCEDSEEISDSSDASNYAVKMGGIFPFSGALLEFGKPLHQSALLATKHWVEAGFPIGWVVVDSKSNPNTGADAARELIEIGDIQVIIGAAASSSTIAVAEQVAIPNQIPLISYASTSPEITTLADQDFVFRTVPSDASQGIVLADVAYNDKGYRNLSILYIENAYGKGLKDVFKDNFEALGGKVVAEIPHSETKGDDIQVRKTYLSALQQAQTGNSEALVAMSYSQQSNVYIDEAIRGNFFGEILFVDGSKSEDIIGIIGPDILEGMCGTAPGSISTESLNIFNASYKEEYGELPSLPFMSNTYDAVIIAGLAAYAAQAIGEAITPITIRDYLRRVADPAGIQVIAGPTGLKRAMKTLDAGLTINYQGASGEVNFDENGDVIVAFIEIWCYEEGTIKQRQLCTVDIENQSSECN